MVPRFCAYTGVTIPLAWEFAWSAPTSENVRRLLSPSPPPPVGWTPCPSDLAASVELQLCPAIRVARRSTSFHRHRPAGDLIALYRADQPALVELPAVIADALLRKSAAEQLYALWTEIDGTSRADASHLLIGLYRFGFVTGSLGEEAAPASMIIREAWTDRNEAADASVISNRVTGGFARLGPGSTKLWTLLEAGHALPLAALVGKASVAARQLVEGGFARAVYSPAQENHAEQ